MPVITQTSPFFFNFSFNRMFDSNQNKIYINIKLSRDDLVSCVLLPISQYPVSSAVQQVKHIKYWVFFLLLSIRYLSMIYLSHVLI